MKEDFYLFHELRGDRFSKEGRTQNAIAAYEKALSLKPDASWISKKITGLYSGGLSIENSAEFTNLHLFTPYYTPKDSIRAEELNYCLKKNLGSDLFTSITLMIDDDTEPPEVDRRLSVLRVTDRPTYLDWVRESRRRCSGQISILANSDIYFDNSLGRLLELFKSNPNAFVALSRFEKHGSTLKPHPDPQWSQDTWAFAPEREGDHPAEPRLDVPMGAPRCDNKIAYVFATEGYQVFNPFPYIRSMHVHETNLRYYDKRRDHRVIGGVAMAHPGEAMLDPAKLSLEIWPIRGDQITGVRVNRTLEAWAEQDELAKQPRPTWIAHDADWQVPAETERHAFHQMRAQLTDEPKVTSAVYLGFPFATLVDLHTQVGPDNPRTRALQNILDELTPRLHGYERVITVCQHIRAKECAHLLANAGVTDLFWPHCIKEEATFAGYPDTRVFPFPLYPVQQIPRDQEDFNRTRPILFSFVGARAPDHYLTDSRNHIIDLLQDDPRGKIMGRDGWHYEKAVYDAQIFQKAEASGADLINTAHSSDFQRIMDDTTFALCPSGSGPNSIRLWESILNGAIPVILADTWMPPGDPTLWRAATVSCLETPEAIAELPDRLAALAADSEYLLRTRTALQNLAKRYGPENFVADIMETGLFPIE